jgi:hypothetical protein
LHISFIFDSTEPGREIEKEERSSRGCLPGAGRFGCLAALACCAVVDRRGTARPPPPAGCCCPPSAERTVGRTFSVLLAPPPDPSLLAYAGPPAAAPNPRSARTPHLPLDRSLLSPHAVTGTAGACMEKIDTPSTSHTGRCRWNEGEVCSPTGREDVRPLRTRAMMTTGSDSLCRRRSGQELGG